MYADESRSNQRLTVKEAARRLNVSEAAIRQRIQRGSIAHEKDAETGRVYIIFESTQERVDEDGPGIQRDSERELIDTLQEQLRLERESSAELRRIIAALTQRIPAIEASPDVRDAPQNGAEPRPGTEGPASDRSEPRARWWRRFFGFGERRK